MATRVNYGADENVRDTGIITAGALTSDKGGLGQAQTEFGKELGRTRLNGGFNNAMAVDRSIGSAQAQQMQGLKDAAAGLGTSAAQIQMQQGLEQGMRQNLAMANSAQGGSGASMVALRGAQDAGARMSADTIQAGAALRAQEQAQAQGLLASTLSDRRAGTQAGAGLQLQSRGQDDAYTMNLGGLSQGFAGMEMQADNLTTGLQLQRDMGVAGIDAGIATSEAQFREDAKARNMAFGSQMIGAGLGVAGGAASGGLA